MDATSTRMEEPYQELPPPPPQDQHETEEAVGAVDEQEAAVATRSRTGSRTRSRQASTSSCGDGASSLDRDETFHSAMDDDEYADVEEGGEDSSLLYEKGSAASSLDEDRVGGLKRRLHFMKVQMHFLARLQGELCAREKGGLAHDMTPYPRVGGNGKFGLDLLDLSPVPRFDGPAMNGGHSSRLQQDRLVLDQNGHDANHAQEKAAWTEREEKLNSRISALERENAELARQLDERKQQDKFYEQTVADLTTQLDELKTYMSELEDRNAQLVSERTTPSTVDTASVENNQRDEEDSASTTSSAEASNQLDEPGQDPSLHEHCGEKMHELWETIKVLKTYVETYRTERDEITQQRDDAIQSAEQAWSENAKLASSANPQQKIKYLQSVKKENAALHEKIRELQARLVTRNVKSVAPAPTSRSRKSSIKSPVSPQPQDDDQSVLSQDFNMEFGGKDSADSDRDQLFRKMWTRNKKLQAEIERLREQQRALAPRTRKRSVEKPVSTKAATASSGSRWR